MATGMVSKKHGNQRDGCLWEKNIFVAKIAKKIIVPPVQEKPRMFLQLAKWVTATALCRKAMHREVNEMDMKNTVPNITSVPPYPTKVQPNVGCTELPGFFFRGHVSSGGRVYGDHVIEVIAEADFPERIEQKPGRHSWAGTWMFTRAKSAEDVRNPNARYECKYVA